MMRPRRRALGSEMNCEVKSDSGKGMLNNRTEFEDR